MMTDLEEIKKTFNRMERNVLILIAIPLPVFALAYFNVTGDQVDFGLPQLPWIFNYFALALVITLLFLQAYAFNKRVKSVREAAPTFKEKIAAYEKATNFRFWQLFWVGLLCAFGLFFYENPGFTVAYAVNLVFISLGKPTPYRIINALRLKGEEREMAFEINKRD
ncbi:MAG: hypothetical protein WD431_10060 [Cyclobacteriaceae bacterium]